MVKKKAIKKKKQKKKKVVLLEEEEPDTEKKKKVPKLNEFEVGVLMQDMESLGLSRHDILLGMITRLMDKKTPSTQRLTTNARLSAASS